MMMKTYDTMGDVENTKVYAKRYDLWRLAYSGVAKPEEEFKGAFGLVGSAKFSKKTKKKAKKAKEMGVTRYATNCWKYHERGVKFLGLCIL